MAKFRTIASMTTLALGLVAAGLGFGSGIASAAPAVDPGMIPMDHGWGWGGDDWDGHHGHGRGWDGNRGWGPGYFPPPCLTVPYVTICA